MYKIIFKPTLLSQWTDYCRFRSGHLRNDRVGSSFSCLSHSPLIWDTENIPLATCVEQCQLLISIPIKLILYKVVMWCEVYFKYTRLWMLLGLRMEMRGTIFDYFPQFIIYARVYWVNGAELYTQQRCTLGLFHF